MSDTPKFDFAINIPGADSIGCKQCQSPFHEEKDCPQTETKESKFQFKSRKEMGMEPGSLPFKFRVDIDTSKDSEVEVVRKRSLMRLNSHKVYNLMGFSVKAHEKATIAWLTRLFDELDIDDPAMQEERKALTPIIQTLQTAFREIGEIRQNKIRQAEQMEELVSKARSRARLVRERITKNDVNQHKMMDNDFWVLRLPDSSVDVPITAGDVDPMELLKEAGKAILAAERSKHPEPEPTDED